MNLTKRTAVIVLVIEALLGAYLGAGGYLFIKHDIAVEAMKDIPDDLVGPDGESLRNAESLRLLNEERMLASAFPMFVLFRGELLQFLTCCALGMLGGVTMILLRIALGRLKAEKARVFSIPLLGVLSGFVVVIVVQAIKPPFVADLPHTTGNAPAIALLAGLFFGAFYNWLEKLLPQSKQA